MNRNEDLLRLLLLSNVVVRNGGHVSLHLDRINKPAFENSAIVIAGQVKKMGTFNWVYGSINENPDLLKKVSMLLNAKLFFPLEELHVPASHSPCEDNNIAFVRGRIDDSDIRDIVEFRKKSGSKVTKAVVVSLFDFREKLHYPEINVRGIYKREDLLF